MFHFLRPYKSNRSQNLKFSVSTGCHLVESVFVFRFLWIEYSALTLGFQICSSPNGLCNSSFAPAVVFVVWNIWRVRVRNHHDVIITARTFKEYECTKAIRYFVQFIGRIIVCWRMRRHTDIRWDESTVGLNKVKSESILWMQGTRNCSIKCLRGVISSLNKRTYNLKSVINSTKFMSSFGKYVKIYIRISALNSFVPTL